MEFKIAAAREESNKREDIVRQLARERAQELERTKLAELNQLQQHHAEIVRLQQEKAEALLAEANRKAQDAERVAQEAREARDKALQASIDDKNKRIDQAVLSHIDYHVKLLLIIFLILIKLII